MFSRNRGGGRGAKRGAGGVSAGRKRARSTGRRIRRKRGRATPKGGFDGRSRRPFDHAGIEPALNRNRAGVEPESSRSRAGVEPESSRSRAGVEPESSRSRAGVGSESGRSRVGVGSAAALSWDASRPLAAFPISWMAWARIRDANRTGTPWRSGNRRSTIDNRQSAIDAPHASPQARKPASTQARKHASTQARKRASAPDSGNLRTIRRKTRRRDDAATRGGYAL
ncbi:Uncharacterised protein [Burkholderia pseudomallei]|nr:Uncharacterised protein [Burkholderia pseudomallei]